MTTRSTRYMHQCLAASGIAVMNSRIAWQLRPDLWAGAQDCAFTFRKQQNADCVHRAVATFPTYGEVLVMARSLDSLEKRLEWIVGEAPTSITDFHPEVPAVSPQLAARQAFNKKEIERLEALRKLATEEPPSHDCHRRREILEARQALVM